MALSPWVCKQRAKWFMKRLDAFVPRDESLLDVGSGDGFLAHYFREAGCDATCVDVEDLHLIGPAPRIYNGRTLPFGDKAFDSVMLVTVLHHCPEPWSLFDECCRVARKRILVIEDRFDTRWQRWMTKLTHRFMAVAIGMSDDNLNFMPAADWLRGFSGRGMTTEAIQDWGCAPPFFPTRALFFCLTPEKADRREAFKGVQLEGCSKAQALMADH